MCTDLWIPAFSGEKANKFLRLDADELWLLAKGDVQCL